MRSQESACRYSIESNSTPRTSRLVTLHLSTPPPVTQVPRLPMFVSMFASEALPEDEEPDPRQPPGAMQIGIRPFDPLMFGRPTFERLG